MIPKISRRHGNDDEDANLDVQSMQVQNWIEQQEVR